MRMEPGAATGSTAGKTHVRPDVAGEAQGRTQRPRQGAGWAGGGGSTEQGGAARAHGPSSGQGALREHSPGEGSGPPRGGGRGGWTRGPLPALACGSSQAPEPRGFRPPLPVPVFLQVCGGFLRNSLWFKGKSRGRKSWAGGEETKPALGGQPTAASAWPAPRPAPGPPSP